MMRSGKTLTIRSSPHIASVSSVDTIMFNVVLALLPVCAYAVFAFGLAALLVLVTATASCVLTEHLLCKWIGNRSTVGDGSVIITGLLYGLVLPPSLPLWMVAAGGIVAVLLGKFLFGGLGYNPFNPALVGRAILQAAFPAAMTSWPEMGSGGFVSLPPSTLTVPMCKPDYDGISGATPLADWKFKPNADGHGGAAARIDGGVHRGNLCRVDSDRRDLLDRATDDELAYSRSDSGNRCRLL